MITLNGAYKELQQLKDTGRLAPIKKTRLLELTEEEARALEPGHWKPGDPIDTVIVIREKP